MSTPGFTAEHSLYRTRRNYCMSEAHHQANGIMLPGLLPQIPASALGIGPPITFCPPGQELCSVSGTAGFCCPPGQSCCDPDTNLCCLPGYSCCNGECCPFPRPRMSCCNGECCQAGGCCNGVCCSSNQACLNGCCASTPIGPTANSKNNYVFMSSANGINCQNILGLKVSLHVTQDMVATVTSASGGTPIPNGGFTMQLNAGPGVSSPTINWMQYVFLISDNAIASQVEYWANSTTQSFNSFQHILPLDSNAIPAGYVFEIDLNNDATGNITGATFTVTDNNGKTTSGSTPLPANQQFPINGFQVNIVGPDNSTNSQFSSGAGTITYEISDGQLCPAADQCGAAGPGESSNVTYEAIGPPCCASQRTQSFQIPGAPPIPCCPPGLVCCGGCPRGGGGCPQRCRTQEQCLEVPRVVPSARQRMDNA
jgi:hypothetical protein